MDKLIYKEIPISVFTDLEGKSVGLTSSWSQSSHTLELDFKETLRFYIWPNLDFSDLYGHCVSWSPLSMELYFSHYIVSHNPAVFLMVDFHFHLHIFFLFWKTYSLVHLQSLFFCCSQYQRSAKPLVTMYWSQILNICVSKTG